MVVNKRKLISRLSKKTGYVAEDCTTFLNAFLDVLVEILAEGNILRLKGYFEMKSKKQKGRTMQSITGDTIIVEDKLVPTCHFQTKLIDAVKRIFSDKEKDN